MSFKKKKQKIKTKTQHNICWTFIGQANTNNVNKT